jgi:hypothetical protein
VAVIYMLFGVAEVVGGAVAPNWWTLTTGILWLTLGASWWWLLPYIRRRREQSAARKS